MELWRCTLSTPNNGSTIPSLAGLRNWQCCLVLLQSSTLYETVSWRGQLWTSISIFWGIHSLHSRFRCVVALTEMFLEQKSSSLFEVCFVFSRAYLLCNEEFPSIDSLLIGLWLSSSEISLSVLLFGWLRKETNKPFSNQHFGHSFSLHGPPD